MNVNLKFMMSVYDIIMLSSCEGGGESSEPITPTSSIFIATASSSN